MRPIEGSNLKSSIFLSADEDHRPYRGLGDPTPVGVVIPNRPCKGELE
jgi:hypothetical protein